VFVDFSSGSVDRVFRMPVLAARKCWCRFGAFASCSLPASLTPRLFGVTLLLGTRVAPMPSGPGERYDFFLSRRGSVAAIAQEVESVLAERGYKVCTQDYEMPLGSSFVEGMHEGIKNSRDLIVLFTRDYERSPYTRNEFVSFEAQRLQKP